MGCIGSFLGLVLFLEIVIGAAILRLVTRWVTEVELSFGKACLVVFAAGALGFVLSPAVLFASQGLLDKDPFTEILVSLVAMPLFIAGYTYIYGSLIKYDYPHTGKPIGFRHGVKIAVMMYVIRLSIITLLIVASIVFSLVIAKE